LVVKTSPGSMSPGLSNFFDDDLHGLVEHADEGRDARAGACKLAARVMMPVPMSSTS
jgi:hypothetical protein